MRYSPEGHLGQGRVTDPLGLPGSNTGQTPIHGHDLDSFQGRQAEVPCVQVGPGSPKGATFGKPGESSPEPPRENTAVWGEGRRGKWQAGIGKAAGGVKYADGEMCECLEKGKTRITGREGAGEWTRGSTMSGSQTSTQLPPPTFTLPVYPEPGLQGLGSKL